MTKYKLAISIPTADRAASIDFVFKNIAETTHKLNIGIYIYDGSHGNETEKVCNEYINKGFSNIHFNHFDPSEMIERMTAQVIEPDCEYLWMSRDRTVVQNEYYKLIYEMLDSDYDVYFFRPSFGANRIKLYDSLQEFFEKFAWDFTLIGSYIIRKSVLTNIHPNMKRKSYHTYFCFFDYTFTGLSTVKNFSGLCMPFSDDAFIHDFTEYNDSWKTQDNILLVWAKNWFDVINELPAAYDKQKALVMKNIKKRWSPLTYPWFIFFIQKNSINYQQCTEYRNYLKKVCRTPYCIILLSTLLPKTVLSVINIVYSLLFEIKKSFYLLFDMIFSKLSKVFSAKK